MTNTTALSRHYHHHETDASTQAAPRMVEHRHTDGTVDSHSDPETPPADDGHEHEH